MPPLPVPAPDPIPDPRHQEWWRSIIAQELVTGVPVVEGMLTVGSAAAVGGGDEAGEADEVQCYA